ncbi:protein of unknown function [Anaerovirgula multivorans]|uniref:DUF4179 domain-containing protein n=1 Tax=Anaerovirgula multivorans TaxID=312168 RepID=A0A239C034_9FIRM|nr:DUF4179 domain-containing protein [Anaerovirgula multivorans]SNS12744.1 protein of unknown function [Anaerovirgula multivorans]
MDIEKMLQEKKKEYDHIEAPMEMEERLRSALKRQQYKKRFTWNSKAIAVVLVFFLFVGYHFDTFAYYGKKIMGYDSVMSESLKDLNQMGKGQEIGQSHTFENGIEVILDGIMMDDNQMLAFYRVKNLEEHLHNYHDHMEFKGLFKSYWMKSGMGNYIDDNQEEIVYIAAFDTPWMFERKLTFQYTLGKDDFQETASLSFTLDRNKAMGHTIKQNINKTIEVEEIQVKFEKITATPTQTLIEGSINNLLELVKEQMTGDLTRIGDMNIKLLANGREIRNQGAGMGMSTNMKGYTFRLAFEPLPQNMEKLEIQLEGLSVLRRPNMTIDLLEVELPQVIEYDHREIKIENIRVEKGNTYITIETEEDMTLLDVDLKGDNKSLKFIRTDTIDYDKKLDGTITHRRDIIFEGVEENLQLKIGQIVYTAKLQDNIISVEIK